jgi:hypothetical protein
MFACEVLLPSPQAAKLANIMIANNSIGTIFTFDVVTQPAIMISSHE